MAVDTKYLGNKRVKVVSFAMWMNYFLRFMIREVLQLPDYEMGVFEYKSCVLCQMFSEGVRPALKL
jgi:hypothetical protein